MPVIPAAPVAFARARSGCQCTVASPARSRHSVRAREHPPRNSFILGGAKNVFISTIIPQSMRAALRYITHCGHWRPFAAQPTVMMEIVAASRIVFVVVLFWRTSWARLVAFVWAHCCHGRRWRCVCAVVGANKSHQTRCDSIQSRYLLTRVYTPGNPELAHL